MFTASYPFFLIDKKEGNGSDLLVAYFFNFRARYRRYVVIVEEYKHQIFVVKFYPISHRFSKDRYNIVIDEPAIGKGRKNDAPRIIRTCVDIMLSFLERHPLASFGFIASNTITPSFTESRYYNQRFRIYEALMAAWFTPDKFIHAINEMNSTYLLINRSNAYPEDITQKALDMFIRNYPDLDNTDTDDH